VVKGVLPQTLDALASMHEAGYAHRVLSPGCIQLSAKQGMNKNAALEDCDPTNLCVKLGDFGRATLFEDASALPGGSLGLVAQDLRAVGMAFVQLLLGSLTETETLNPETGLATPVARPPPVTTADLARQMALFDDRITGEGGFAEFCRGEQAWNKVVALLDADDGAGWQFLELLVSAPSSFSLARAAGEVPGLRTASGMASHPFLQTEAIADAARGVIGGRGIDVSKRKLFGLFEW
jgi:hypothetical protein